MRIYLDNCCYNRPYDDQSQLRIHQEAEAKLYIQDMICQNKLKLVTSFMSDFENNQNRNTLNREHIKRFMRENESYYIVYSYLTNITLNFLQVLKEINVIIINFINFH